MTDSDDEFDRVISDQGYPDGDIVTVLESAAAIQARDREGLLWTLATAGSQVRRAVAAAAEWVPALADADPPRSVLVVTDSYLAGAGALLAELAWMAAPVVVWPGAELPRWVGPADALIAASIDGMHPRVAGLAADADRRGLAVVAISPDDSPVAAAAVRAVRVAVEAMEPYRASVWSLCTPMLLAAHALGVVSVTPMQLAEVAESLDALAVRCGPAGPTFGNEAKQLAVEFADADPVLLGSGSLPSLAAAQGALALNTLAGAGAVALRLPDHTAAALALLTAPDGPPSAADFFRDRLEPAARGRRYLAFNPPLVDREHRPALDVDGHDGAPDLVELATARAAARVRDEAARVGVRYSVVEPEPASALAGYAQLWLLGEFVAAYLAIGRGIDLGERAPGL